MGENFWGKFFGRIFREDFLGGFFWEDFLEDCFWKNSLRGNMFYFNVEGIDLFVKILSKSRRKKRGGQNLDP